MVVPRTGDVLEREPEHALDKKLLLRRESFDNQAQLARRQVLPDISNHFYFQANSHSVPPLDVRDLIRLGSRELGSWNKQQTRGTRNRVVCRGLAKMLC